MNRIKNLIQSNKEKAKYVVVILAAIVVFVTTYSLMLPAITLEKNQVSAESGIVLPETSSEKSETVQSGNDQAETEKTDPVQSEKEKSEDNAGSSGNANPAKNADAGDAKPSEKEDKETNTSQAADTSSDKTADVSMPAVTFTEKTNKIKVDVWAPEGSFPEGTTMKIKVLKEDADLSKVTSAVEDVIDTKIKNIQAVDISFYNKAGDKIEPKKEIIVTLTSEVIKQAEDPVIVHIPDKGQPEIIEQIDEMKLDEKPAADEVVFESDSFSIYAIIETTMEKTVLASDGHNYKVTVTCGTDSGIPEGAELEVEEILPGASEGFQETENSGAGQDHENASAVSVRSYEAYVTYTEHALGIEAGTAAYIRLFDIKIVNKDDHEEKYQPKAGTAVDVRIELAGTETGNDLSVVHFPDGSQKGERVGSSTETTGEGTAVEFTADGFSVYAVVDDIPDPVQYGETASDLSALVSLRGEGGFYLSVTRGFSYDNYYQSIVSGGCLKETTNINEAAVWYFEPLEGTDTQFYIYCMDGGSKKYIQQDGSGNNVKLSDTGSVFEASAGNGSTFYFKVAGTNQYLQHSNGGGGIRLYGGMGTSSNSQTKLTFVLSEEGEKDPYQLDGKSFGILNYKGSTTAYAMMAEEKNNTGRLNAKETLVRTDPMHPDKSLYVARNSDISMWTFESVEKDIYYLKYDGKYVRINASNSDTSSVTLADQPDEYCRIRVIPGTGDLKGRVRLVGEKTQKALNIPGDNNGFFAHSDAANSNGWQNLAEYSVYTDEDFVEYSAYKVSVSDQDNVKNGKQVVIYTRVWNDTAKKYEFYAVDHNGSLVPCYESGDSIVWIGAGNNTLLWEFTEYYYPGTTNSNGYYDLQNTYTGEYIGPQISGGQVFSESAVGINLNGRRYGDYYTPILAWDDAHYDYAGFKVEDGKIVSCPMSQADTFYFAVIELSEEHTLTPVKTVDHEALGLTMKIVDFDGNSWQDAVLGSSAGGMGTTLQQGLLATELSGGSSGYPQTAGGHSLGELYAEAEQVNHLFIQSIYDGSGYYQFDSSENFAHYNPEIHEFEVYQELGSVKGGGNTHSHGQFMPFNSLDPNTPHADNPQNLTDIYGRQLSDDYPRKYEELYAYNEPDNSYFGVEVEGHFMQPASGLDAWGHDIIFEFVGDDDFWLYVDGELIIDLGGKHSAVGATVNYRTGKVVVNGQPTTLYDLFKKNYANRNGLSEDDPDVTAYLNGIFQQKTVDNETVYVFKDYSSHDVRIFYMERGAGASNLRMRFNLATVTPGQVLLEKEITGTEKQDFASMKFPFQIYYQTDGDEEYHLLKQDLINGPDSGWNVVYQNSSTKVEYKEQDEIDGVAYTDVFYLKPGQIAAIQTPDNTISYYIKECGIDTSIYDEVQVNGETISGITPEGATNRQDFESEKASVPDRAKVTFSNHVNASALRTLTVKKRLFDAAGNELTKEDDGTGFTLRLYLGEELGYYNQGDYFVKDPDGYYCSFDPETESFSSVGVKDFSKLTADQLLQTTFRTSPSGAASKLPAGYSIEIRDLLVGTSFKVTEEDYDIPTGYGKRIWEESDGSGNTITYTGYKRVAGSYLVEDGDTQNSGVIRDNSNPEVEVHNQKGWGIRAEKVWSDADYMLSHANTYFAVYVKDVLLKDTVRRIDAYGYTTYFFPSLQEDTDFSDYQVYEVELTNPVIRADGRVTAWESLKKLTPEDTLTLDGVANDGEIVSGLQYSPSYKQGTGDTSRTDTVTNTRIGGLRISKEDMEGNPLPGAVFTLTKENSDNTSTFTSDANGLVTTAYLETGTYLLTETGAPSEYQVLTEEPIKIEVNAGVYEIEEGYGYTYDALAGQLTVKNRPFTLRFQKVNGNGDVLEEARFALYKQITANGSPRRDYYPMAAYSNIISDSDGLLYLPDEEGGKRYLDQTLKPGTYYLSETAPPANYDKLGTDICFTISPTGIVSLENAAEVNAGGGGSVTITPNAINTSDGRVDYRISVVNGSYTPTTLLRVIKTDQTGKALAGAVFEGGLIGDGNADQITTEVTTSSAEGSGSEHKEGAEIAPGEAVIIPTTKVGAGEYTIREVAAPAGYMQIEGDIVIRVDINESNGQLIVSANVDGKPNPFVSAELKYPGTAEEVWLVKVVDSSGYELPNSGGSGTNRLFLFGFLLTALAGAAFLWNRKRQIP